MALLTSDGVDCMTAWRCRERLSYSAAPGALAGAVSSCRWSASSSATGYDVPSFCKFRNLFLFSFLFSVGVRKLQARCEGVSNEIKGVLDKGGRMNDMAGQCVPSVSGRRSTACSFGPVSWRDA